MRSQPWEEQERNILGEGTTSACVPDMKMSLVTGFWKERAGLLEGGEDEVVQVGGQHCM